MLDAADPRWWLEGSSYPIRILDKEQVRVLITSRELGEKYGEEPVAVLFNFGKGDVFHMISHYFLQWPKFRNARHQRSAASYAEDKGVPFDELMADTAPTCSSTRSKQRPPRCGCSPISPMTRNAGFSKNNDAGSRSQDLTASSKGPDGVALLLCL